MGRVRLRWIVAGCAALAAVSLLAPSAPSYDPWSWLIWGRELVGGDLDTRGGPAWKPLPVVVAALLSPAGEVAPSLWLVVARGGALVAAALAWRLAARLGAGSVGGAAAAGGVLLTAGWVRSGASGGGEGLLVAIVLLAAERHLDGRHRQALGWGILAALVRVETWPFLGAYALWLARRDGELRRVLAAVALVVPAVWFLPELAGSGDLLRSSARARVVESGAPALAAVPALASLRDAAALPFAPLVVGCGLAVVGCRRRAVPARALAPLAVAVGWCAVVAAMSELGYSGEARYALPGAALVAITGACGLAWAGRTLRAVLGARPRALGTVAGVALVASAPATAARVRGLAADGRALADAARLRADLGGALAAAGGRDAVLRCGRPYVGPRRGPLVAWHLRVPKAGVGFVPRAPGVVFRSALRHGGSPAPQAPRGFRVRAQVGRWMVLARCRAGAGLDA